MPQASSAPASASAASAASGRRSPWPRLLARIREAWFGVAETVTFFAAILGAVGRFLIGRWPEPPGRDYLAPKGRSASRKLSR